MGIFAGQNPNSVDVAQIARIMRPALYAWFNARIQILDPHSSEAAPYDPKADAGGAPVPTLIWDSGPKGALVEVIRAASGTEFGGQGASIVGIQFQTHMTDIGVIRAGLLVRVLDGGEDKSLPSYTFAIREGLDGSIDWGRTIDATVVSSGIAPGATPPAVSPGYGTMPFGAGGYGK